MVTPDGWITYGRRVCRKQPFPYAMELLAEITLSVSYTIMVRLDVECSTGPPVNCLLWIDTMAFSRNAAFYTATKGRLCTSQRLMEFWLVALLSECLSEVTQHYKTHLMLAKHHNMQDLQCSHPDAYGML